MKPGPELDALVAKHVMGWRSMGDHWANGPTTSNRVDKKKLWRPSTDISCAWEVVEKTLSRGLMFELRGTTAPEDPGYQAEFKTFTGASSTDGDTAPHAISLAALKAAGAEVPS